MWNPIGRSPFLATSLAAALFWLPAPIAGQTPTEPRRGVVVVAPDDAVSAEFAFQQAAVDYAANRHRQALQRIGETDDHAARYLRGLNLLASGESTEAIQDFQTVVERQGPPQARLDLATAYLAIGQTEAAESALAPYLQAYPDDAYAHFLQGTIRFRQGRMEEANAAFDRGQSDPTLRASIEDYRRRIAADRRYDPASDPTEPFRTPSGQPTMEPYVQRVQPSMDKPLPIEEAPRRWNFTVLTAFEHDTNVALAPNVVGLGAIANQDDTRFLAATFGDFQLIQRDNWNLGLIASTFNTLHFELDEFNVQDYMGGAYSNVAVGIFLLGVNYQFHETLVDGRQFSAEHRLVPSATVMLGDFGHSTAYYEYDQSNVDAPALIPAQFRSGDSNALGFTQAVYLPRDGRLFGGYRLEVADTDGSDFDRQTHMVTGRIEWPVGKRWVADAEIRYFWDDYDNPNSLDFFERPRSDERVEVRAGLQHYFNDHLSLRFDYTFIDSNSNVANLFGVEFYSYDRNVFSTQLIYDF